MSSRLPTAAELDEAVRLLEAGELVAFPTETVYGLGADAENPEAVARIFAAKGRPSNHPVIVHVVDGADVDYWADTVPEAARKLIDAFWPGPLTLILKRAAHIPAGVAGGQDSLGLRCPSHPVAQALLSRFRRGRGGIAAPSANKFGQVSPTTAQHVRDEFGDAVYVLEGDGVDVGIESTIVDLSRLDQGVGPVLLRPGAITPAMMAAVLGTAPLPPDAAAPRASGTLRAHYAPRTPLVLADAAALPQYVAALPADGRLAWVAQRAPGTVNAKADADTDSANTTADAKGGEAAGGDAGADARCVFVQAPSGPEAYARELYRLLRRLDKEGFSRLVFEPLPAGHEWDGVRDRLGRAAAAFE